MEYNIHTYTTKSKSHKNNEDNFFVCDDYIIVADGMGGESDGDIASLIAIESIGNILSNDISGVTDEEDIKEMSRKAISNADSKINEYIDSHPDSFGMGTTIILTVIKNDKLFVSWCGDSHCYVYKNGKICSITKDHSYVQQLIDLGQISIDESFTHPQNNLITRFVGGGKEMCIPDFCSHKLIESEIIILCSDGLSGYCKHYEIERNITNCKNIEDLPKSLSNLAIQRGSDDDITIIVLVPKEYNLHQKNNSIFRWIKKYF